MDRVAVLVDAGYFFAAGSALVSDSGQLKREHVVFDANAAVTSFTHLASKVSGGLPLLRIYWYDGASRKTGPSADHVRLAGCNDVKVRLGFLNASGQQKGVDSLIVTDMVELARNKAVCDVVLMSGDEDVRIGVQLAQGFGSRVHLIGMKPCAGNQSADLRHEADTCTEWDAGDVRAILSLRPTMPALPQVSSPTAAIPATDKPTPVQAVAAAVAHSQFDPVIEQTLGALAPPELQGVVMFLAQNAKNLPHELDGRILARCRTANGGINLDEATKRYVRNRSKQRVQELAAATSAPTSAAKPSPAKR